MKIRKESEFTYYENKDAKSCLGEIAGWTAPIHKDSYSIAITNLAKGGNVEKHFHKVCDEVYVFTQGSCTMLVNDKAYPVHKGSIVVIEPMDWHELPSCPEKVTFYAICVPPYNPEDYFTEKQ